GFFPKLQCAAGLLLASIHTALPLSLTATHSRQFLSPLPRRSPPNLLLRNLGLRLCKRNEGQPQFCRLFSNMAQLSLQVPFILCGKNGVVICGAFANKAENDPGQLVRRSGDRLGHSQASFHPTKVVPEPGLTPMQTVGRHAKDASRSRAN